jgi:CDP-paratose 2-epimerase
MVRRPPACAGDVSRIPIIRVWNCTGFLSYLVKVQLTGKRYLIRGYKGKQVRDNIHSYDVARAIESIYRDPGCASVYNIGGGREIHAPSGKAMQFDYSDSPRSGDHICYITDLSALRAAYPQWCVTRTLNDIVGELVDSWNQRIAGGEARSD